METEGAGEEGAGADETAGEEAAKAAAAEAGDGPEAAGASGAAPTADPSAAAAAPGSEESQPGAYLKAGDGVFIKLPWSSSSRAPIKGEIFDEELLASAGLTLVDAPSSSSACSSTSRPACPRRLSSCA